MARSLLSHRRLQALAALALLAIVSGSCGGNIGPTTPTVSSPAVLRSVVIQGGTQGTTGDEFPLTALVIFSDATSQTLTTEARWSTSSAAVATVNPAGQLKLLSAGECDVTVAYTQQSTATTVQATKHVVVTSRSGSNYTLFGVVSGSATGRALSDAVVSVVGGTNNGRATKTDPNGYYSVPTLLEGTFTLRFARDGYENLDQTVTLTADTRRDVTMKALPPPPFAGTYAVQLTTTVNTCSDITPGSSGTVTLSGTALNLLITMTERGIARDYRGSMDGSGAFSGSGSGLTQIWTHEFTGGISGRVVNNSTISGTEGLTITLGCPGGVATITTLFTGFK